MKKQFVIAALISFASVAAFAQASAPATTVAPAMDSMPASGAMPASGTTAKKHHKMFHRHHKAAKANIATPSSAPKP